MNPLAHAARVLARIYEASASAPVPVDLADDEDTEPVPVAGEMARTLFRPDRSHDTKFEQAFRHVAADEAGVLGELAVLTGEVGPWDAALFLFAPDTPCAALSATETAERRRSDPSQGVAISDPSTGKSEPQLSSVSPSTGKGDHS